MNIKITSSVFIMLMQVFATQAQMRQKEYTCAFVNNELIIDGNGDESIWNDIEPVWFIPHEKEELIAKSWFKSTWNHEYLYFLCWMQDNDIQARMTQRDDYIWHEEVLEIFIDADSNPKTYYEFEWNALNTLLDLYVLNPNCNREVIRQWWGWDCKGILSAVNVKGTVNDNEADEGWFLEVAIPFSQVQSAPNIPPVDGDIWKLDLMRREGTEKEGTLQKSSWLPPSTHFPLSYGQLIFKK